MRKETFIMLALVAVALGILVSLSCSMLVDHDLDKQYDDYRAYHQAFIDSEKGDGK